MIRLTQLFLVKYLFHMVFSFNCDGPVVTVNNLKDVKMCVIIMYVCGHPSWAKRKIPVLGH